MPNFLYSNLQNDLANNFTLILNKDYLLNKINELEERVIDNKFIKASSVLYAHDETGAEMLFHEIHKANFLLQFDSGHWGSNLIFF